MKIAVIHQYYLMPGQFGGSRFNEMAKLWAAAGHDVTVIAGTLEHGTGLTPERYRGRWVTKEQDGAVAVYRCHVPATYGKSFAGRMWAFLGFTFSATWAALRLARQDVVIATSPPLIAVIPGWVAARFSIKVRSPWIFEMRDLWPESAVTTGVLKEKSALTRLLYAMERWACRKANRINVLTPAFRDDIVRRGLAGAEKIVFVPNGADTDFVPGPRDNEARRELGWGNRFVATYAGAHGRANAVGQLLDAAEELKDRPDIFIACFGDGPERKTLEAEGERRGLQNVRFYGPRPKTEMPQLVNASDAGLAVLQNNPTFRTVYPNKVFDYMSCSRPSILAIGGVARELVCDQAKAGIFAEPENGKAIARALRWMADHPTERAEMGRKGREWVMANASRPALATRYLDVMERLVRG